MPIARLNQWLGRYPSLKRTLVRIVARIPYLDMRLRVAAHEARHRPSKVRIDANHLPEEATFLHRRLTRAQAGKADA